MAIANVSTIISTQALTPKLLHPMKTLLLEELFEEKRKSHFLRLLSNNLTRWMPQTGLSYYLNGATSPDSPALLIVDKHELVLKSHAGLIAQAKKIANILNIQENDVMLNCLEFSSHTGLLAATLFPLLEGIPIILSPEKNQPADVGKLILRNQVSLVFMNEKLLTSWVQAKDLPAASLKSLRLIISNDPELSSKTQSEFKQKFNHNVYPAFGLDTLSPLISCNLPDAISPQDFFLQKLYKEDTVGMPIPGNPVRIINPANSSLLPPGKAGLLSIGNAFGPNQTHSTQWYNTEIKGVIDQEGFLTLSD